MEHLIIRDPAVGIEPILNPVMVNISLTASIEFKYLEGTDLT